MDPSQLICLVSRWVHIASSATLLGGVLFARFAPAPLESLAGYARIFQIAIGGSLLSGIYNFLMKPSIPAGYHAVFGIKVLLALHVFAVAGLLGRPGVEPAKQRRQLTGIVYSGAAILALAAYLRYLSTV